MVCIRPFVLSMVLVATPAHSQAGDLTTRDIVELSRSGLGDAVLIALVDVDGGPFNLSPADLLDLKAEGLSDQVLAALVRAGRPEVRVEVSGADYHETFSVPGHDIHTVAVPVPVPVYVPVDEYRGSPLRNKWRSRTDGKWRSRTDDPAPPTPGVRRGPVTVDSIRHAPPGFHPGTVRSRTTADRSRTTVESDASARPTHQTPQVPATPGIARSTTSADRPATPGVARSQRPSEP